MKVVVEVQEGYEEALLEELRQEFPQAKLDAEVIPQKRDPLSSSKNELAFSAIVLVVGGVIVAEAGKVVVKKLTEDTYEYIKKSLSRKEIRSVELKDDDEK